MCIRSNSLILSVDQNPQTNLVLGIVEVLRNARLEGAVRLVLENTECGKVRCRPVSLIETRQIKSLMLIESLVRDNLEIVSTRKELACVLMVYTPWRSSRDAAPHAPSSLPRSASALRRDDALHSVSQRAQVLRRENILK